MSLPDRPTHVVIKLDQPVGPDEAQDLAEHVVSSLAFADVEWARPAIFDNVTAAFVLAGEEVSWSP